MANDFDAEIAKAIALHSNWKVVQCNIADFVEDYDQYKRNGNGYPEIEREFDRAVEVAIRVVEHQRSASVHFDADP